MISLYEIITPSRGNRLTLLHRAAGDGERKKEEETRQEREREMLLLTLQTKLKDMSFLDQIKKMALCPSGPGVLNPGETRGAEELRGVKGLLDGPRPSLTQRTSWSMLDHMEAIFGHS